VGHVGVLDEQGGRGFGVSRENRGSPRVYGGRGVSRPLAVGRCPCMERGLPSGRGASDRRGNVACHGAGHHAPTTGLVLRYRVRRSVVRVRVRVLCGRLARQSIGDLRVDSGCHVAPTVHGGMLEFSLSRLLG